MQTSQNKTLIQALAEHNPFVGCNVDKASTVWTSSLPDLEQHNQHVSECIDKALELLKQNVQQSPIQTLVILASIGMGKTQLFSRIRRNFFSRGKALFSYINAGKLDDARLIHTWFRKGLVADFARLRPSGVSQWQEITSFLITQATGKETNAVTLSKNFDDAVATSNQNGKNLFKSLYNRIAKRYPGLDPYLVRSLLWTLSASYSSFALKWLAGDEVDQATADMMGIPPHLEFTLEQREADSLQKVPQILQTASLYKPVIIGLDELEDPNFLSDEGFGKEFIILNYVKDLYEFVESLEEQTNGILVISSIVSDDESVGLSSSTQNIAGIQDRISTANNHKELSLQRLTPDLGVELLKLWLKERLYQPHELTPPDPLYPFEEAKIREICSYKPTPREFLTWCAEQYKAIVDRIQPGGEVPPDEEIFKDELAKIRQTPIPTDLLSDSEQIGTLLRFGFMILDTLEEPIDATTPNGEAISQLKIDRVSTQIPIIKPEALPKVSAEDYLDFKIEGHDSNGSFCIGIGVCQATNYFKIQAELKRLAATERFGFTRSCLVRSKDLNLKGKATLEHVEKLIANGGEIVGFTPDELEPLWHLYSIVCKVDMGAIEFKERRVGDLIVEFELDTFLSNPILLEILSSVPNEKQPDMSDLSDDEGFELLIADNNNDDDDDDSAFDDLLLG
jgi:hypothetical protein